MTGRLCTGLQCCLLLALHLACAAGASLAAADKASNGIVNGTRIAIVSAVTSKGTMGDDIRQLRIFRELVKTVEMCYDPKYNISLYMAFDLEDKKLSRESNRDRVAAELRKLIPAVPVHWVPCDYHGKPAWAQNDGAVAAFRDGNEYVFRINDDTQMHAPPAKVSVFDKFISVLNGYNPPKIGVVGPRCLDGNLEILTHDFTHRTHFDIFGYYYPRVFTDWYGDDWITRVYEPHRTTKLSDIVVRNKGHQRYAHHMLKAPVVWRYINEGKDTLAKYLQKNYEVQFVLFHGSLGPVLSRCL